VTESTTRPTSHTYGQAQQAVLGTGAIVGIVMGCCILLLLLLILLLLLLRKMNRGRSGEAEGIGEGGWRESARKRERRRGGFLHIRSDSDEDVRARPFFDTSLMVQMGGGAPSRSRSVSRALLSHPRTPVPSLSHSRPRTPLPSLSRPMTPLVPLRRKVYEEENVSLSRHAPSLPPLFPPRTPPLPLEEVPASPNSTKESGDCSKRREDLMRTLADVVVAPGGGGKEGDEDVGTISGRAASSQFWPEYYS